VHGTEEGRIRQTVDGCGPDRRGDQLNVVPVVLTASVGSHLEHGLRCVDTDDGAGGADLVLQQRQAQPGAAADVEDGVAALER
jgi:hypothetical protein